MAKLSEIADVRVRFAPSPTGTLHVGNARTALYNYLFAKRFGGSFVLRIEDTDRERSSEESEQSILEDLAWMGLSWDEGPDIGGPVAPYRQSQRLDLYNKYIDQLIEQGAAYRCFCDKQTLDDVRAQQQANKINPHYTGTCRAISPEESARRAEQETHVVRFKIPDAPIEINDQVRGNVRYDSAMLGGDLIIRKSDGFATYNFAVVVDDHLMDIHQIVRGEDHLTNTAKQFALYDHFGWPRPQTWHLSIILGPDRSKLSKRHGSTSIRDFRERGYHPEAVRNYLALLGWNNGDDVEEYSDEDLQATFHPDRFQKSSAIFDYAKLGWMSGRKFKQMSQRDFAQLAETFLKERNFALDFWQGNFDERLGFFKDHIEQLSQLPQQLSIFNQPELEIDEAVQNVLAMETIGPIASILQSHNADETLDIGTLIDEIKEHTEAKGKTLFQPLRLLVTGKVHGPDLNTIAAWIPQQVVQQRIENVLRATAN